MKSQIFVFTDIDGTLADYHTYSIEPALPALDALKKNDIPLIICSSKTRAEIEKFRSRIDNLYPFISENGGAVFIPIDYFSYEFPYSRKDFTYLIIEFGTPYHKIRGTFQRIQSRFPGIVKGFADMSAHEVANLCEFSAEEAVLAKEREFDEPFILEDKKKIEKIQEMAQEDHLQIIRGGRFYHLIGENDKGKAISYITDISRKAYDDVRTIALGDSQNDLSMLQAVDFPVLIQKPDGSYDPAISLDNLIYATGIGPAGWNDAVLKLLDELV
jgi:mannosyl-3-phosphoglycerate phosphatase